MPNTRPRPEGAVDSDTIAAVATAAGMGGIGVVRISGPAAGSIGQAVTGRTLSPRRATHCRFRDAAGATVDAGIAISFPGPHSFTGEDVVELQGHGGPMVLQLLLDTVMACGARLARPGEFTERAYLNGKLDLAQAEAVADLIASASAAAARGAMRSLEGEFSHRVNAIDADVVRLRVFVEAAMDFPEEDADFLAEGQVSVRLASIAEQFAALLRETRQGVLLRDGIAVALVGQPNVGKSSLLNRLAGQERAIVADIPGTTRDLIHADLTLDGMPVQIVDTAGLRESTDPVELEGVRRARDQAARADLVLVIEDDRQAPVRAGDSTAVAELLDAGTEPARLIRVCNKIDLSGADAGAVEAAADPVASVRVSALSGAGLDSLVSLIKARVGYAGEGTAFTARRRHIDGLQSGAAAAGRAAELLHGGAPAELVAEELRAVHEALGSIVGTLSADELLGEIFASFCIGK
ncbi:MAG: tRNA uridine-5-carboxymethylaminomethyl(34) synthesis GTPase MnmE [Gammaproteobacteria bacterium]|nr:tRNA uridine-5-carboxymethylaminomethyl(34) synthesis GTPase MnmE [Gammaproteobacteria bacterium]